MQKTSLTKQMKEVNMHKVEISDKDFEKAIERHEKEFEKELEEVDIKKVVLKTKKAVLEQARQNNSTYNHAVNAVETIRNFERRFQTRMSAYEESITELKSELYLTKQVFSEAIDLLRSQEKERHRSFFVKFWEFIKCLMKSKK